MNDLDYLNGSRGFLFIGGESPGRLTGAEDCALADRTGHTMEKLEDLLLVLLFSVRTILALHQVGRPHFGQSPMGL